MWNCLKKGEADVSKLYVHVSASMRACVRACVRARVCVFVSSVRLVRPTCVSFPVAASHTLRDLSADPVTRYWESPENVTHVMRSAWLTD